MRICVTTTADNLDANVDPRFGRCKHFLIIDTDSMNAEPISNESMTAFGGAGIQAAQTVAKKDVDVVITGNIGPNAFQTLRAAGIEIITGASGNVKEVVEKFKKGEFKKTSDPTVGSHYGLGGGRGFGRRRYL